MDEVLELVGESEFNEGKISLYINQNTIENNNRVIKGRIDLSIYQDCLTRGLWIKLVGSTVITLTNLSNAETLSTKTIDLLVNEEDYHVDGIHKVFYGFGEHDDCHNELLTVNEGTYSYIFIFDEFKDSLPLSYHDFNIHTSYKIICMFDCPIIPVSTTQIYHNLLIDTYLPSQLDKLVTPSELLGSQDATSFMKSKNIFNLCIPSYKCGFRLSTSQLATYNYRKQNIQIPVQLLFEPSNKLIDITVKSSVIVEMCTSLDCTKPVNTNGNTINRQNFRLWNDIRYIRLDKHNDKTIDLSIDLTIDPLINYDSLVQWPDSEPVQHHLHNKILHWTETSRYFIYKVYLKVAAYIGDTKKLYSDIITQEIYIKPPNYSDICDTVRYIRERQLVSPITYNNRYRYRSTRVLDSDSDANSEIDSKIDHEIERHVSINRTPFAKPMATKVTAEAMSYGPTAVLIDRLDNQINPYITPTRYASIHKVELLNSGNVFNSTNNSLNPFSPIMASIYRSPVNQSPTESLSTNTTGHSNNSPDDLIDNDIHRNINDIETNRLLFGNSLNISTHLPFISKSRSDSKLKYKLSYNDLYSYLSTILSTNNRFIRQNSNYTDRWIVSEQINSIAVSNEYEYIDRHTDKQLKVLLDNYIDRYISISTINTLEKLDLFFNYLFVNKYLPILKLYEVENILDMINDCVDINNSCHYEIISKIINCLLSQLFNSKEIINSTNMHILNHLAISTTDN